MTDYLDRLSKHVVYVSFQKFRTTLFTVNVPNNTEM